MIKRLLLVASTNKRLEKLVTTSRLTRGLVSRFVAGTTLQEAIAVTRELQAQKIDVSLDLLGETVDDLAESATRRRPTSRPFAPSPRTAWVRRCQ